MLIYVDIADDFDLRGIGQHFLGSVVSPTFPPTISWDFQPNSVNGFPADNLQEAMVSTTKYRAFLWFPHVSSTFSHPIPTLEVFSVRPIWATLTWSELGWPLRSARPPRNGRRSDVLF